MSIHSTIREALKPAMLSKDAIRLQVIRGLLASFTNELIAKKSTDKELDDAGAASLINRAIKQRKDSIEQFTKGGRADLADAEKLELSILETFAPQAMPKDEIRKFVENYFKNAGITANENGVSGANSAGATNEGAKTGQLIGAIMKELKGKANGADVKEVVEAVLGGK